LELIDNNQDKINEEASVETKTNDDEYLPSEKLNPTLNIHHHCCAIVIVVRAKKLG
jgi:hypothetical protein